MSGLLGWKNELDILGEGKKGSKRERFKREFMGLKVFLGTGDVQANRPDLLFKNY